MQWKSEVTEEQLNFDIAKKPLFIEKADGTFLNLKEHKVAGTERSTDRVALWNERDNQLLGVVSSKKYNAVPHGDILDSLNVALDNLKLEPQNTKITATPNFNRFWVDMTLDAKHVDIGDDKDDWDLGVTVGHGLDGMAGLHIGSFVSRLVCSNGMRATKMLGRESKTHRYNNMVEWFEGAIVDTLNEIDAKFDIIPKLFNFEVQTETFLPKVEKIFGKKFMQGIEEQIKNPSSSNPLYRVGKDSLSLYDAMNCLTWENKIRAENVGARVVGNRYVKIESLVNSYLKVEA